ncbi:MAG: ATP-binding cassette domain-containing protein [Lachnospiraceae bacterium]|nr:ATP-binding cassette domain-containing protein [Lachnospiraceae bacterium]
MRKKAGEPGKKGVTRVPVIIQLERRECGAACLSMVAAYYDKWVPLEQTRIDCGVSKNGASAGGIVRAAKSYGFNAKGYTYETKALKEKAIYPCIIHWNMKHFVVLCGFKGDRALIIDPGKGKRLIDAETFDKSFTGVCIIIEPGEDFVPSGEKKSVLSFVKKRLKKMIPAALILTALMIANGIFGFIDPYITRIFLDEYIGGGESPALCGFIALMLLLAAAEIAVTLFLSFYRLNISGRLAVEGSTSYVKKLLKLPIGFFEQRGVTDLIKRSETNASVSISLVSTFAPLIIQSVLMAVYLFVMLSQSVVLTVVGLAAVVINLNLSRYIAARRVEYSRVMLNDSSRLSSTSVAGFEMMESLQAMGATGGYFNRWAGYQAGIDNAKAAFMRIEAYLNLIPSFASTAANYLIMLIGVYLTMEGRFTLGMLMAFLGYLSSFMMPADTLINMGKTISEASVDMERIEDVMEYPDDPYGAGQDDLGEGDEKGTAKACAVGNDGTAAGLRGELSVKGLSFGYERFKEPLIKDFNLTLRPGERAAVIGHSGCGKTTVMRLMAGLYIPWEGDITYDGRHMADIGHRTLRSSVGVVDQNSRLFNDTILENIRLWDESVTLEQAESACKCAGIHQDILGLKEGYATLLSEGGSNLSGGQRQRLEIARALVRNPSVLFLDEATASLDEAMESRVLASIAEKNITTVIVSHRLSAIRDCDRIIVMDRGRIVAEGTHSKLLRDSDIYARLVADEKG